MITLVPVPASNRLMWNFHLCRYPMRLEYLVGPIRHVGASNKNRCLISIPISHFSLKFDEIRLSSRPSLTEWSLWVKMSSVRIAMKLIKANMFSSRFETRTGSPRRNERRQLHFEMRTQIIHMCIGLWYLCHQWQDFAWWDPYKHSLSSLIASLH